jgi:hypothetical protein
MMMDRIAGRRSLRGASRAGDRLRPSRLWLAGAGFLIGATLAAAGAGATEAPSPAEGIAAFCSTMLRASPPEEAVFLAENTGAMTPC